MLNGLRDVVGLVEGVVHLTDTPSIAILSVREVDCVAANRLANIYAIAKEKSINFCVLLDVAGSIALLHDWHR